MAVQYRMRGCVGMGLPCLAIDSVGDELGGAWSVRVEYRVHWHVVGDAVLLLVIW